MAAKPDISSEGLKHITELLNITTRMLSVFNLDKLLEQILDTTVEFLKADTGSLMLIEEKTQTLKIKAAKGLNKDVVERVNTRLGEKVAGWVAKEGKPLLLIGGLKNDARFSNLDEKKEIKSSITVPLKVENRVIGVLNVNNVSSEALFSESDLMIISLLANQAAISIWNVRLYEETKKANQELIAAQQQLIASEKMAALGQLSTGIAHEINNPLTTILGNIQYLMDNVSEGSYGREELQEIKEAAEFCARIIERIFNYCRPSEYKQEAVDVNNIAERIVDLVKSQFERQRIKIILDLGPHISKVIVNPDELKEVFLNIILNAKVAMPTGGALTISTKNLEPDKAVEIRIADTGCGIPKNIQDKIFDPFFTTRRPGSAGLGLSICQRIVNNYKGSLSVQSEAGKGATFIVKLPQP
ncbi:MAG: ATP-binding protein [Candidatus Omnitrophica bacterium]|nr:ATP-binding protein [Candidatus Omnitrophota bacterium]